MAYDPKLGKVVLFGGEGRQTVNCGSRPGPCIGPPRFADTWTYDGKTWTQQHPATSPPARAGASMAYDPHLGKLVLLGGGDFSDMWTYDGITWIRQNPATSPPPPLGNVMAYDAAIGKLVVFTAFQTWTYNGETWTKVDESPETGPLPPSFSPITYDGALRRLVGHEGRAPEGYPPHPTTTWTYNGKAWIDQSPPTTPPLVRGWSMAYDPAVGHTVLFGGDVANDTWIYDGKTWLHQFPATAPTPRSGAMMVYDAALNSLVLFGGCGPQSLCSGLCFNDPLTDTWTYGPTLGDRA
jgi:hypothetical protein